MNAIFEGMEAWHYWLGGATSTVVLGLALIPVARSVGLLDHPSRRKTHRHPTPLVGGIAIFASFFSVLLIGAPSLWGASWTIALVAGCGLVLLAGLVDDRRPLSATVRFLAQGLACCVMIFWGGVQLLDFGQLFGPFTLGLGWFSIPITIFAALGVINAFNMIDGLDGLSGSVFAVACAAMALLAGLAGQEQAVFLLILATACALGFLALNARWPWNHRARIFLGDSGSVFLGFYLAWMFIDLGNGNGLTAPAAFAPMTAVWIIGLPLMDTTRLMRNRWKAGRSAFEADRQHLHHAFLAAGFSVRSTWLAITGLCAVFAAVGIAFEVTGTPDWISFYAFVALGFAYLRIMKRVWDRLESGIFAAQAMFIRK